MSARSFSSVPWGAALLLAGGAWGAAAVLSFQAPLWLALAPAGALLLWWNASHARWISELGPPQADTRQLRTLHADRVPTRQRLWHDRALLLAWWLAVLSLARPTWGEGVTEVRRVGSDVVIALDLSHSMLAEDVHPNRLEASFREIDRLLELLRGDRVGLVVFAGSAFVQTPLTTDHNTLRVFLRRLHPDWMPRPGTAIAAGLEEAHRLLVGTPERPVDPSPQQLIILVTDGEDHEGEALEVSARLAEASIALLTVGVGTEAGGPVPLGARPGSARSLLRDASGEVVITRFNEPFLRELAGRANGPFLRFSEEGQVAAALAAVIAAQEGRRHHEEVRRWHTERYPLFALGALLALLVSVFLARSRPHRNPGQVLSIALFLLSACEPNLERLPRALTSVHPDYARAGQLAPAQPDEARRLLEGARARQFHLPHFHFALGLVLAGQGQHDGARHHFLQALASQDDGLRARALVGLGVVLALEESWDEAHERLRRALDLAPDLDAARSNLVWLHHLRYPACETLDRGASRHRPEDALPLAPGDWPEAGEAQPTLCHGRPDYFLIQLLPGDMVRVDVNLERAREDSGGPPTRTPEDGLVQVTLVDASGEVLARSSPVHGLDEGSAQTSLVSEALQGLSPRGESLLLRLEAAPGWEFLYAISLDVIEPCRRRKGPRGAATTKDRAWVLDEGEDETMLCPDAPDWYVGHVAEGVRGFLDVMAMAEQTGEVPPTLTLRVESDAAHGHDGVPNPGLASLQWVGGDAWLEVSASAPAEIPYQSAFYRYGPCSEGDDRRSPNHRRERPSLVDAQELPLRHLRLCSDAPDYFLFPPPPPSPEEEEELGLTIIVDHDGAGDEPWPELRITLPSGEAVPATLTRWVWEGSAWLAVEAGAGLPLRGEGLLRPKHRRSVLVIDPEHRPTEWMLRIEGEDLFYHLSVPELQESPESPEDPGTGEDDAQGSAAEDPDTGEEAQGSAEESAERSLDEAPSAEGEESAREDTGEQQDVRWDLPDESVGDDRRRLLESLEDGRTNLPLERALREAQGRPQPATRRPW